MAARLRGATMRLKGKVAFITGAEIVADGGFCAQ
jgi:hypothetical protein